MLTNFFRVAFRNFMNQRLYSLINVAGLASGLTCTLFIFLWVRDEVQKDKLYKDSDKIYHVVSNLGSIGSDTITWPITPGLLADGIKEKVSGVSFVARTMNNGPQLFEYEDKKFLEKGLYADPELLKIFDFTILEGNIDVPPLDKSWTFISRALAKRLFGNEQPVGKHVRVSSNRDMVVAAVFEDLPNSSSLRFEYLISIEIYREIQGTGFNWGNYNHPLYLKLNDEKNLSSISHQINDLQNTRAAAEGNTDEVSFYLQKFSDYYLNSHYTNGRPDGGRIKFVQIFSIVAAFILIIACINFMNMATAKAMTRAKEVGVKKVVGAQRISLVAQFLGESMLISLLAMFFAIATVTIFLSPFNDLVSKQISLQFSDPILLLAIIVTVVITGAMAGCYPAFFLSSFQPGTVLKGNMSSNLAGASLRRMLVVFQFSLTVILIVSALVVRDQIDFIMNKEVGYDRQSIINLSARGELFNNYNAFRNDVLQDPGVESVSKADNSLVQVNNQNGSVNWPGKPADSQQFFRTVCVDADFPETMGLKLIQGRLFSHNFNDTSNFIITEKTAEVMGLTNPIGQKINQWGTEGTIVGVVRDFHSQSLHNAIDPIILFCKPEWARRVFIKLKDQGQAETVQRIEKIFKKHNTEYPFEYTFLTDDFEKLYKNERVTGALAIGFTAMAIIISGLGLMGLAAYMAQKRRKEISIRKTMGASVSELVTMMSRSFVSLSMTAIVIGCPIAYFLMESFLGSFVYHTSISINTFVITSAGIILVALLTVVFQVFKAAVANPITALRNE